MAKAGQSIERLLGVMRKLRAPDGCPWDREQTNESLKSDLIEESQQRAALERMRTIQLEIKKERPVGRRGGAKRWPVDIVLLICEMLVNGTNPTAVPANIQTSCAAFRCGQGVHPIPRAGCH